MDDPTIAAIARGLERWNALLGRQYGPLSRPQRRVLAAIAARGEVRVGDLAEVAGMTSAGATRMVDTLEDLGYVYRFRQPEADQRQVFVAPTPQGLAALEQSDRIFATAVGVTVAKLKPSDQALLARLLDAIGNETAPDIGEV